MIREKQIIKILAKKLKLTERQVKKIMKVFKDTVVELVQKNKEVHLKNFGTFKLKLSKARIVHSVDDINKIIKVSPKYLFKFYSSHTLRRIIGSKKASNSGKHIK